MTLQELREKAEKAPDRLPVVRPHTAPTREDLDAVEHYAAFHAVVKPSLVLVLLDVVEKAEKALPHTGNHWEAYDDLRTVLHQLHELVDSL